MVYHTWSFLRQSSVVELCVHSQLACSLNIFNYPLWHYRFHWLRCDVVYEIVKLPLLSKSFDSLCIVTSSNVSPLTFFSGTVQLMPFSDNRRITACSASICPVFLESMEFNTLKMALHCLPSLLVPWEKIRFVFQFSYSIHIFMKSPCWIGMRMHLHIKVVIIIAI